MKPDEIDNKIINILKKNGRTQNKDIAEAIDVSEGTIRNRLNKLISQNYLKIKGLINPNLNESKHQIYILVRSSHARDWETNAKKIAELPEVNSVAMLSGRFDFVVEVFLEPREIINFISNHLATLDNITSTETLIAVRTYNKWI